MMTRLSPDFEIDKFKGEIIMAEKNIKTRIIHKHDTEENWNKATNFIPKQGEIIVYDIDSSHSYERIKVGDGTTNVISLPFVNEIVVDAELSATSKNPVQNKVVKAALDKKIDEPTNNGLVRKFMSGMYGTMGVDDTMPDSPTNASVPTTKLLKDYVEDNTSNPLKLSDTDLQNTGLLAQSYQAAGSTPGTVGKRTYDVVTRDISTLEDTISGLTRIPSSYAVGKYVMEAVAFKADASNPLELSDTDKTKSLVLIQHNYDSETQTEKYIARSIDTSNLSESGLAAYNIPTSKAVAQYVQNSVSNKVDKVEGKGLSTNDFTNEDKDTLDTLLYAVDINSQAIANVNERKVDKVEGKGLSTNDYTNEDKAEVAKIASKADISNPLQLSDTNLQKSGLLVQTYQAAGSTPGTTGATTYTVIGRDTATLDDSISGAGKIPSSYAVGEYVKKAINSAITMALNTEV